jgi:hypothetical protein
MKKNEVFLSVSVCLLLMFFGCTQIKQENSGQNSDGNGSSRSWALIDGNGVNGINKDPSISGYDINMSSDNQRVFVTWVESYNGNSQVRVKMYDTALSTWEFIDKGNTGINFDATKSASLPESVVSGNKLYVVWVENNGVQQIRVRSFDIANKIWDFIDGNHTNGINYDVSKNAYMPSIMSYKNDLYVIWYETQSYYQIRVKKFDHTSSTWSFVDGGASTGISYNTSSDVSNPRLCVFNGKLYAMWNEEGNGKKRIRAKIFDENALTWSSAEGGNTGGLNVNPSYNAYFSRMTSSESALYATWREFTINGSFMNCDYSIRMAKYDGTSWTYIDGNSINNSKGNSLTDDVGVPYPALLNGKLFVIWEESLTNIRVKAYNGSAWEIADSNNGLQKTLATVCNNPVLTVCNGKIYSAWSEVKSTDLTRQIRVASY